MFGEQDARSSPSTPPKRVVCKFGERSEGFGKRLLIGHGSGAPDSRYCITGTRQPECHTGAGHLGFQHLGRCVGVRPRGSVSTLVIPAVQRTFDRCHRVWAELRMITVGRRLIG